MSLAERSSRTGLPDEPAEKQRPDGTAFGITEYDPKADVPRTLTNTL